MAAAAGWSVQEHEAMRAISNTFYVETHLKFSLFLSPCFV